MCGISGFFNFSHDMNAQERMSTGTRMNDTMIHRGPDCGGIWCDADSPLVMAHRRLSILDLSEKSKQPMFSASGRYAITFNGEIYNYPKLKKDLETIGYTFKTTSDTETVLNAFEYWGVDTTLQKINGMFAFALYDRQKRHLHLVRDRFGKKPLYIGWAGKNLIFASELKALRQHPDFRAEIGDDALALYTRYSCVPAPYSIYKNIWQLLPATKISINLENVGIGTPMPGLMQKYWDIRKSTENARKNITQKPETELIEEFDTLLTQATKQRMMSDVPLGAFLSGGVDSSAVVAIMQKLSTKPVKTCTIAFESKKHDESSYAARVAKHLGTDHHEFTLTAKDVLETIPKMPEIYDEPFADQSQIPTYLLCSMAKKQVTVALTGDGGDEILGGYNRHFIAPYVWQKISWIPHIIRKPLFSALSAVLPTDSPANRLAGMAALKNEREIYKHLTSHWQNPAKLVTGVKEEPQIPLTNAEEYPKDLNFGETMIYGDTLSYRTDDLMVKTDRASMAVSLECRSPLMDYKLMEYCWTLPHDMKIRGSKIREISGKWLLKQVLAGYLPKELLQRPKQGFSVPLADWLRGELKDWAGDMLSPDTINRQGLLNSQIITAEYNKLQSGIYPPKTPERIWNILMFQSWLDKWHTG